MILVKRRLSIFHALRGATLWCQNYFKFMVHEKLRHILSEYTLICSDIKPYLFLIVTYRLISGNIKSLFFNKAKKKSTSKSRFDKLRPYMTSKSLSTSNDDSYLLVKSKISFRSNRIVWKYILKLRKTMAFLIRTPFDLKWPHSRKISLTSLDVGGQTSPPILKISSKHKKHYMHSLLQPLVV